MGVSSIFSGGKLTARGDWGNPGASRCVSVRGRGDHYPNAALNAPNAFNAGGKPV
jgi:hypothetical protein